MIQNNATDLRIVVAASVSSMSARPGGSLPRYGDMHPLLTRLQAYGELQEDDLRFLAAALPASQIVPADTLLVAEGSLTENVHLIVGGLACRCKDINKGRRQITGYLLPGDFCDLHIFVLRTMDHTIRTLGESRVIKIARAQVEQIIARPTLAKALLFSSLVDASVSREWVTNIGQRNAMERLAHLFCEIYYRMQMINATHGASYNLPINQTVLADTVGLSLVHTNKSLRNLYKSGLVRFISGKVDILDIEKLKRICNFSSSYLHQDEMKQ